MSKLPAIQFYTADWLKDPELRVCSSSARGVWIDCLCVMSESQERGVLRLKNGNPVTTEQLAGLIGIPVAVAKKAIKELEANGVFSRTPDGAIFSKRMVEDEKRRQQLKANGETGGRPKSQPDQNQEGDQPETKHITKTRTKTEPKTKPEENQDPNQNGGSSSSSSIAISIAENNQTPNQEAGEGGVKPTQPEPRPKPNHQPKPKPRANHKADPLTDPRFREFWSAYPRKVQEIKAASIYAALDPSPDLQAEILAAVSQQKTWPKWVKDDGEYIPYPANWLENQQWRDKLPEVGPGPDDVPAQDGDDLAELRKMAANLGYGVGSAKEVAP